MDFIRGDANGSDLPVGNDGVDLMQDAAAAAAAGAGTGARILVADAAGVVTLPPGTELSDIRVIGRDLVIVGADGVRYVIPDGAIVIPQLVVGDVAIPPLNLAALLIGNEPQPAAGNTQSSGGNFASAVGPLQAAYGLGDLLPYTELNFPQPEEREIIPNRPDREPDVVVVTPDQPAGATSATAQVNEAGLPARNGEPAGTNAASNSETTTGSIVFGAPDGLSSIAINGTVITTVGQTIQSPNGTLTVTSIAPGVIGYSYTLADNMLGTNTVDTFAVTVTDTDGDVASATLTISVIDDAPIANNDTDRVAAGTYGPEVGNVMTGTGTTSGAAGADQQGADGAKVTAVSGASGSDSTFDNNGNLVVVGQYGTLTLQADGSYSYVRTPGTAGGVTDTFTYTLTDNDGSADTATLTITVEDSPASVVTLPVSGSAGTVVDEAGLPPRTGESPGTAAPTNVESTTGAITVIAPDGIASVQVGGTTVTGAGQVITLPQGTLLINSYNPATGQVVYTFTLTDNTSGDNTTVAIPVTVTDVDGDSDTKSFTITIIDDAPQAVNDTATQTAENAPVVVNVLANDIPGADSVQPGTVTLVAGSLTGAGQLTNNGDGTFTYTPGAAETGTVTFDYSITDGDGDKSTARVTITLQADSTPTIATLGDNDVIEAGLPARNGEPEGSQAAGNGETANGTIAITTGNDTIGSLVINGLNVTAGGTVTTTKGTLTVASDGNGGYTYSYTLADNTLSDPDSDSFSLTVTDSDGSQASTTLVVAIVDDAPSALDDAASLAAGQYGPIGGNVRANDTQGADGATVTSYSGTGAAVGTDAVATGAYGTLTIAADGTFVYTRNPGSPGGVTDSFDYTITDADGDPATATLTITIPNSTTTLTLPTAGQGGTSVLEEALSIGSNPTSTAESTQGTITFTAPDGPAILTIDGNPVTAGATITGAFGSLVIDAVGANSITYTYTLTTNTSGDTTTDTFTVRVEDQDGDFSQNNLVIGIVDDVPTARPDTDSVTEDAKLVATGNVITDAELNGDAGADTRGADGATVTAFSGPNGAGVVGNTINGTYGTLQLNATGGYTYTLNNASPLVQGLDGTQKVTETFNYTITDGDGDARSTTLIVTVNGADDPVTITGLNAAGAELIVDEDDLANGSSPNAGALVQAGNFTVTGVDGIASLTIEGVNAFVGQTFTNAYGTFKINSISAPADGNSTSITVGYQFTLTDNTAHPNATGQNSLTTSFDIAVTDTDGSAATDTIDVQVIDDVPQAFDNSNTVTEGGSVGGNILSDATDDVLGADDATIQSFVSAGGGASATPGNSITTALGTLTVNADGSYTYVSKSNSTNANTTDTFNYTIIDSDGDPSTAQLVINISNVGGQVSDNDVNVNEAGLSTATTTGSNPGANSEIGTGQISVVGALGPFVYKLVGANSNGDGTYGTLVLDPNTGSYTYTLDTPFTDNVTENSANVVNGAESFGYEVYDTANNLIGSGSIAVNITDDIPNAVDETARTVAEDAPGTIGGNVLTNDIQGADHASLTHVNVGGGLVLLTSGTNLGGGVYQFTTANGVYTFTAGGSWTFNPNSGLNQTAGDINAGFTYRLTDGDGDFDDAAQPITITDGAGPVNPAPVTLNLDDQLLSDGRTPGATQPPSDSETIAFVPGSDPFASIVFGSTAGLGGGLTWVKSADNLSITGSQGGRLVVTLTLEVTGNNAKVVATLNDNYLHADGLGDQNFDFGSVEVVATDIDGDKATALATLEISDDLPTLAVSTPAANSLLVDETALGTDATADFSGLFTPDYNADGAGTVGNYTLGIKAEGADTGLIDTASGQKVVLHFDGTKVVGWTETSHLTVFEVTVSGSTVKLDQQRAIKHGDAASVNEQSPVLAADLVTLTATVTDADKDSTTATANIGGAIRFLDDGPTAVNDTNSINEDGTTVNGNVLLGNDNTANTADDDKFGADGQNAPPVTAISGFGGAGTVGGTTVGKFGSLTLNSNGTYTYTVDTTKTQALDTGDTETDVFTYQIKDGDGDPTTATLTISIIGANDAPIARADTNWTVEDAAAAINGNVLNNVDHTRLVAGDFKDVADNDVDDAVAVQTPGVFVGTYGTLTLNADGSYSYQVNNANAQVQALGIGDAPLVETFNYSATDGTTATPSTLKISIFGANDAPSLVASTATVSDEGFAAGNKDGVGSPTDVSNSTTFLTGNITITDKDATDTFTVTLGTPVAPTIRVADGSATGAALTWALADGGKTLVGYVTSAADPSVLVKITNAGTYTVEILDPIFHPNTTVEDIVSGLVIPVTVTDDSGAANASTTLSNAITVVFEDDSPTLGAFAPAANTVSNVNNGTAVGNFAYAPGGDGHGTFTITGPTIAGVVYQPLVHGLIDITNDAVANPVQGTTLTATTSDGLTTLFTMQVDVNGHYKFTLVTADAATSETLSFKSLSAGGPGFRELEDDTTTPINEAGRVEFTSNGTGVNANNNDFGVSNSFLDPEEFFVMEFHNPGVLGDQAASSDPEFLSEIDVIVNTLQSSGGRNGPGQSGGPNVTLRWTATNTATGDTETGTVTVSAAGLAHIDPSIEFNQMKIENFDNSAIGTDGGRIQIGGVKIYKVILPQDETIDFDVSAKDADGDTTTVSHLSVFIDATPPVALDLDGDGVEFLSLTAGVGYDYGQGQVATAWVGPDDGLLARNTGFGLDLVFTDNAAGASTDLEGLRLAYDSNSDGQLTSDDADWSSFGVWSDADSDGVVDDGEFVSLDQAGITSIGLTSDGQAYTAAGGDVRVSGSASFTRADGTTGTVADAVFATEARNAQRTAEIVSTAAIAGAVVNATAAAAALPPIASDHAVQHLPTTNYTREAIEPDSTDTPSAATAAPADDRSDAQPAADPGQHGSSAEANEAPASLAEPADRDPGAAADHASDVAIQHAPAPALFGGASAEGVMQALMAMAPADAPAAKIAVDPAAVQNAMSDFAGANLVDTIVDHFTGGNTPAIAMVANDHVSQVLAQTVDGGISGAFHDPMIAMADADAHALAAAQA